MRHNLRRILCRKHHTQSAGQVPGQARINNITMDREGKHLAANCSDRIVRLYQIRLSASGPPRDSLSSQELRARISSARVRTPAHGLCCHGHDMHAISGLCESSRYAMYLSWTGLQCPCFSLASSGLFMFLCILQSCVCLSFGAIVFSQP